jgi:hypothetical protein
MTRHKFSNKTYGRNSCKCCHGESIEVYYKTATLGDVESCTPIELYPKVFKEELLQPSHWMDINPQTLPVMLTANGMTDSKHSNYSALLILARQQLKMGAYL